MELFIAGGCGDFGRSCFFVSGKTHSYIVDCGTSTDGLDRVPDLTEEQIERAEYLFLTHSHRDHTGAVEYLDNMGFTGAVLMSNQTYRQLSYKPNNAVIMDSSAPDVDISEDFSFQWGRTGHCAGAVWYLITCEGKTAFFSGDYREDDPFYMSDPVRDRKADIAVIDAAYNTDDTGPALRKAVMSRLHELICTGLPLLLPVPRFGRGLSIAMELWQRYGRKVPVYMSPKLFSEWKLFARQDYFSRPQVFQIPLDAFHLWDEKTVDEGAVYLLTDAQLSHADSRSLIEDNPDMSVVLTGSVHGYGQAKDVVASGRAEVLRWPAHMTNREMKTLAAENYFGQVIPFHDPHKPAPKKLYTF